MPYTPLGSFTAAQLFNDVGGNAVFASLTDLQKSQVLNAASQRMENECFASGLNDYLTDSIDSPALSSGSGSGGLHFVISDVPIAGYKVVFDVPFSSTTYAVQLRVYNSLGTDVGYQSITRELDGVTIVPNENNAIIDLTVGQATVIDATP